MLYRKFAALIEQLDRELPSARKSRRERKLLVSNVPRKYKLTKKDVKDVAKEMDGWGFAANTNMKRLLNGED